MEAIKELSKQEQIRLLDEKISRAIDIAIWRERNGFKNLAEPAWALVDYLKRQRDKLLEGDKNSETEE